MGSERRSATIAFTALVVTWWLLIAGVITQVAPAPAASSPGRLHGLAPGQRARIHQPGIPHWPIPVEREAYDEFYRGTREGDEDAIDRAFAISEWLPVEHGQAVMVIEVDGETVHVELLEGQHADRRGWVKARNLRP
jgi:hypothetical protein